MKIIELILISFVLNVLWSMMGRARNRNNVLYHSLLVIVSNFLWIFFMKELISSDTQTMLFSCIGSSIGAILGQPISMFIEKKIGAKSDDHIIPK
mgnify:CR=1 FL=1|jgi:ABC-type nitrate/sulfonate/bicarbonate transport system permease component